MSKEIQWNNKLKVIVQQKKNACGRIKKKPKRMINVCGDIKRAAKNITKVSNEELSLKNAEKMQSNFNGFLKKSEEG